MLDGWYLQRILCQFLRDAPDMFVQRKDMQETLEKEQKADEDMYDDLQCWCKDWRYCCWIKICTTSDPKCWFYTSIKDLLGHPKWCRIFFSMNQPYY